MLIFLLCDSGTARQTDSLYLGIRFQDDVNSGQVTGFFERYGDIRFTVAELAHPADTGLICELSRSGVQVYVRTGFQYMTAARVGGRTGLLADSLERITTSYGGDTPVAGFGLFRLSETYHPAFDTLLAIIRSRLPEPVFLYDEISTETTVFSRSLVHFSATEPVPAASYLIEGRYAPSTLRMLNKQIAETETLTLLLMDAGWFDETASSHPAFPEALTFYQQTGSWLLPLPDDRQNGGSFNYLVFVYLLLLASLGIHYRLVPNYPFLMLRYFTARRFFVDDIMSYRERTAASGVFLFFQHALFTGLVIAILSYEYISGNGLRALYHHLPQLAIAGQNYFSLFLNGFILGSVIQMAGVLWLYLPSRSMRHFSQTMNLYTWLFHLDFVVVTLMLVTHLKGGSDIIIIGLAVLFVLIWLTTFSLTAFDSARYMPQGRIPYILYTFGAYMIVNVVLLSVFLLSDRIFDLLRLVIRI